MEYFRGCTLEGYYITMVDTISTILEGVLYCGWGYVINAVEGYHTVLTRVFSTVEEYCYSTLGAASTVLMISLTEVNIQFTEHHQQGLHNTTQTFPRVILLYNSIKRLRRNVET